MKTELGGQVAAASFRDAMDTAVSGLKDIVAKHGPGSYRFNWVASGRPAGDYTFRVTADDDQGQHSVAERDFTVGG